MNREHHYRAADVAVVPLRNGMVSIYTPEARVSRRATLAEARALQSCDTFQTLSSLADRLAAEAHDRETISAWFRTWLDNGFLVSREVLERRLLASAHARQAIPAIESICVLTRNRSAALERCLLGFAANVRAAGRNVILKVFDNAMSPGDGPSCEELVRGLASRTGVPMAYVDAREKRRLATCLVDRGVPEDVVTFALFGAPVFTRLTGANRNAVTLLTSGTLSMSVDDDEECRVAVPPVRRDELGYFAGYDPSEYWFFPDRGATLAAARFVDADVLGLHERLLGQPVPLSASSVAVNPASLNLRFVRHMTSRPGQVRATLMGIVGDCGMATPRWLWLSGPSRARLVETEAGYRSAFTSPEIFKSVDCETISAGRFCMTGCIGYDNRDLLPPFFPGGRNTDGVFGTTLRCCFPDAYFGHVPWALLHTPQTPRLFPAGVLHTNAAGYDLSDILGSCIKNASIGAAAKPGEESLRRLGAELTALGQLPLEEFEEYVRLRLAAGASASIHALEVARRSHSGPDYWAHDVDRMLESLEAAATLEHPIPRDFAAHGDTVATRLMVRDLVRRFGALLEWWPAMVSISKTVDAQTIGAIH